SVTSRSKPHQRRIDAAAIVGRDTAHTLVPRTMIAERPYPVDVVAKPSAVLRNFRPDLRIVVVVEVNRIIVFVRGLDKIAHYPVIAFKKHDASRVRRRMREPFVTVV